MKLPAEAQANPRAEAGPSVDKPTCKGTTKAGNPCRSTVVGEDGYCLVHSPSRAFDPVETGRQGGKKSGVTRRALSKSDREQIREGRERLREQFENDPAFYEKVKTVYREALEAVTTCPGCHEHALPDHRTRLTAGDSFLGQIYGKPRQEVSVHQKNEFVLSVPTWWFERETERRRLGKGEWTAAIVPDLEAETETVDATEYSEDDQA